MASAAIAAHAAAAQTTPAEPALGQENIGQGNIEEMLEGEVVEHAWVDVVGANQREFPLNDPKILRFPAIRSG